MDSFFKNEYLNVAFNKQTFANVESRICFKINVEYRKMSRPGPIAAYLKWRIFFVNKQELYFQTYHHFGFSNKSYQIRGDVRYGLLPVTHVA